MSEARGLLDRALKTAGAAYGRLTGAWVQRRGSRRLFISAAIELRHAADLLDEAAAHLPQPKEGTPPSE